LKNVQQYIRSGFALVPIPGGSKGPNAQGWNLRENCITTAAQARRLNGSNVGLAHAYCTPQPTGAIDVDDFSKATAWLAGRGVDLLRC
jgi:hypothetical protein